MEKKEKISLETMAGVGKKKKIAGREYYIIPVNIADMRYVIGTENPEENLFILDKKKLESDEDLNWQAFGLNIIDEKKKKTFMYILNKYVFYCINDEKIPMTEKMLIEHNWSFKEIGDFIYTWCQLSD